MSPRTRRALAGATALALSAVPALSVTTTATAAVSPTAPVVINEVYGGGGNSGAVLSHDFIELVNTTGAAVDLTGWTLQYASAAGTSWSGVIPLQGSITPGEHYVVRAGTNNASVGDPLPVTPRVTSSVNLAAANGNVALTTSATALTCRATACAADASVVDLVGFGTGAAYAGTGSAPAPSATTSTSRDHLSTNTADNRADFEAGTPTPGTATPAPDDQPPAVLDLTIPEVQGTGATSPVLGQTVAVRGVVTAAYPSGGFRGLTIQTPGSGGALDDTHVASHGLFVFQSTGTVQVEVGQYVEVTGVVAEFNGLTQVVAEDASAVQVLTDDVEAPKPVTGLEWPRTDEGREVLESMLFEPYGTYTVTNVFATNQFGEVGLAFGDTPLIQPTDLFRPLSEGALAVEADNRARAVVLDDASTVNFLSSANRDLTPPYLSVEEPVRVGAAVDFPEPVIVDYRFGAWRFQPTFHLVAGESEERQASFENTRPEGPDAERLGEGELTVGAFNVLNYFPTLGNETDGCTAFTDRDNNGVTVRGGCQPRGAWDEAAFERQQTKIVSAITTLDAAVTGLIEMENSVVLGKDVDSSLATLVAALNEAAGEERWAFVPSSDEMPAADVMDVITNAIIYQPALVTPVGQMRVLGDQSGAGEAFSNAREPVGQVFEPAGGGEPFLVVVNHFKSKGSGSGVNADQGDGQAASNPDRVRQATALRDWVPTVLADHEGLTHTFLVGDFNAYSEEDPMHVLYDAGYVNVNDWMAERGFERDYSYSFSGLLGSLDHILVSSSLLEDERVTGADIWNINAFESVALEYSRYNYHGTLFYEPGPFRSSDHDPAIVAFRASGEDGRKQPGRGATPATPATPAQPAPGTGKPATPATPATPAVPPAHGKR